MAGKKRRGTDTETITATKALPAAASDRPAGARPASGSSPSRSGSPRNAPPGPAGQGTSLARPAAGGTPKQATGAAAAARSAKPAPANGATAAARRDGSGAGGAGTVLVFPKPAHRRRRRTAWIAAGSVVLAIGLFFAFLFYSPVLALKTVVVEGTSLLPLEQAEAALEPLKGQTLPSISDDDVAALLKDRPEIEDIDVAAQPPSTLVVTITERTPVAVLQDGAGHVLIDEQGRRLATAADRASVALPLIAGGSEAVNAKVFPSITSVLAALPPNVLGRLESASAQTVDSVELKLDSGQTVFWGSADANAAKARVLEALLTMAPTDPPVAVYDVSAPERPVTR